MDNDEKIKEYEAHKTPVPSYEELQNMNKVVNECMAANIKLVERERELKETISILKNKLVQYKPELEEWVNKVTKELEK